MRKVYRFLICLFIPVIALSCEKERHEDAPVVPVDRTVLVYMAADNNLYSYAMDNIGDMLAGMRGRGGNLIVYLDASKGSSQLLKIGPYGTKQVIETYEKENSASAAVLKRVIDRTMQLYPASSYGLVLWSHGLGWIPAGIDTKSRAAGGLFGPKDPSARPTKYFGMDWGESPYRYMEITDLAAALPAGIKFDFLLFDACFMSNIETIYDLRTAARYLIGAPTETMATGFPYHMILPYIFSQTVSPMDICRQFVAFYRSQRDYPSGGVALVQADQLDALAVAARRLIAAGDPSGVDAASVQYFENMQNHVFFDMADYYSRMAPQSAYAAFAEQLDKTVLFADHTDRIYSGYGFGEHWIDIDSFCGLSTYIPRRGIVFSELNDAYKNTAWAQAVGLAD